jgi:hypothetical protein
VDGELIVDGLHPKYSVSAWLILMHAA